MSRSRWRASGVPLAVVLAGRRENDDLTMGEAVLRFGRVRTAEPVPAVADGKFARIRPGRPRYRHLDRRAASWLSRIR